MKIRPYDQKDFTACIDIFQSNRPVYFAADELPLFENWLRRQSDRQLANKKVKAEYFYVLENGGLVTACGGFYISLDSPVAGMAWGMVHSRCHKQGLGKILFEYRIGQIKTQYPQYDIILDTTQHTYAFFEKQSFSITQIRKDFYEKGMDRYDMILDPKK